MTAVLAEAPGVAWFVPVTMPGRAPRRLTLVGSPGSPGSPGSARPAVRAVVRRPPAAAAPRLRLTRRGAHVVALAALTVTVLGGVARLETGPPLGATSVARVAPGTPLTGVAGSAVNVPER
jgi:hypothetical protein